jgi:hypothetical protein
MIEKLLRNRTIIDFIIREYNSCSLSLNDGYSISTQSLFRFVGKNDFICVEDHGHKFGMDQPYDAEKAIKELIQNKTISKINFNNDTGDLNLVLETGTLQIICRSAGYEAYQIDGPNNLIMVVRGGKQE